MSFFISTLTFTSISLIAVMGVFIITGLTGLFSLGQASFMAVGAYTAGVLVTRYDLPFAAAIVIAVLAGVLFSLIVGLPTLRLRRDYIALVTFGFGEAIIAVLHNMASVTGGAMGLSGIPIKTSFPLAFGSAALIAFFVRNFKYSRFGRQCIAIKADELAARAMGIHVGRVKLVAFLTAGGFTAYAGVLFGFYTSYVDPGIFNWTRSAEWIIMVFFGGMGSLTGAVFAAFVLGTLPEILRFAAEWRVVIYSLIVLVIINYRPSGLFGSWELGFRSIRKLLKPGKQETPHD
jgi:branched-chain amino acid transport system permease protein